MANLLNTQNMLKNLSDEQLDQEVNAPTGSAPSFMLMAEMQRRQNMRQAYEGEVQRANEGRTTVMEDLMRGTPTPTAAEGAVELGASASPPTQPPIPLDGEMVGEPMQTFQYGGQVQGLGTYADLGAELANMRAGQEESARMQRNLGLAQIGFGIAAGTSPFFATNLGGAQQGLQMLSKQQADRDAMNLRLLGTQADLIGAQQRGDLAAADFAFRQAEAQRRAVLDQQRLAASQTTASMREYERALKDPAGYGKFLQQRRSSSPSETRDANTAAGAVKAAEKNVRAKLGPISPERAKIRAAPKEKRAAMEAALEADIRSRAIQEARELYPHLSHHFDRMSSAIATSPVTTQDPVAAAGLKVVDEIPDGAQTKMLYDRQLYGFADKGGW